MTMPPLKILVLEDHEFQRAFVVATLRHLGCTEIYQASEGAQAIAVLKEHGPVDIAICDLQMEGMDGIEFLYQIANSGLVRSVVISSTLAPELRRSVQKIVPLLGINLLGDIEKPCDKSEMAGLLVKYARSCYQAPSVSQSGIKLESETEVRRAFEANEFTPYFQPKFNLETGEVFGAEVLARWLHPSRGLIAPSAFIPMLERCDLMDELFFRQLNQCAVVQRRARNQGHFINFSLNMQSGLLSRSDLHAYIGSTIAQHTLPSSGFTFELTESDALDINPSTLGNLLRLRMLGCKLSIDDFGCGHSSLQRLCELPFNEIKIDARFVQQMNTEPRCRAVISNTHELAASLGMSVVVEGIETSAQRVQLMELGCTLGQGYWYARPMSGEDLLTWLDVRQGEQEHIE
ncbi:EAL domain-containing protein [Pseudomonas sp. IPO3774]|uniref:EAL domain-containing response regulator n=1 Tax=Pseudomonas sp. IPO3774 TaxID=2738826 RepID=UPI0015A4DE65|nr:EAL domain-containing response regulator [Pseudomonas sp. IPO3774]NWD65962.1 EAL domain-containing response regulator [Pseudomonas sp. IPO3774]